MTTTEQQYVTGYQLAQLANFKLEQEGVEFDSETNPPLQPQMVYSYITSGRIPTETVMVLGKEKKLIRNEVAAEWIANYVASRLSGQTGRSRINAEAWFAVHGEEPSATAELDDKASA